MATKVGGIDPPAPPSPWKRWEPAALITVTLADHQEARSVAVLAWAISEAGIVYIEPDKPGVPQGIPAWRILGWAAEGLDAIGGSREEEDIIDAAQAGFYGGRRRRAAREKLHVDRLPAEHAGSDEEQDHSGTSTGDRDNAGEPSKPDPFIEGISKRGDEE